MDIFSNYPAHFDDCLTADRHRLRTLAKKYNSACKTKGSKDERNLEKTSKLQQTFTALLERSRAAAKERKANLPTPSFDQSLPVNAKSHEISELILKNQVTVVCGETGSGKTTQLPQICLKLGRGIHGMIGHTQPRRIAARSVASRLAKELNTPLGESVGLKIRFHEKGSPKNHIKLMTDGILLAEIQSDPYLTTYDTLIIDEAHERSLNIDFLLGYLKRVLHRRPEFKLIVTSATIDAERFAKHFNNAPIIEISGRMYPVEIRYRPIELEQATKNSLDINAPKNTKLSKQAQSEQSKQNERSLFDAIVDAVSELSQRDHGDILIFLPGEREIREAAKALHQRHPPHTEILPLFSRLSIAEQDRIFKAHTGRRIVLATNVAETSLTVPGIHCVIDTGLGRVKRYSFRNKIDQLQIEKISQASAKQRAGRCGRVASGICIRLYEEIDFENRPAFSTPEILRSSLAGVILKMKALKLGTIEQFSFLEAPSQKSIADGYTLLQELGALDAYQDLTRTGRALSLLPLDPRIARMLVAAQEYSCLHEILIIAAALSIQDPRERPQEKQQAADEKHLQFSDERSEFLMWPKLWRWYHDRVKHKKSNRQLMQTCREHFLSPTRLREWVDTHTQLKNQMSEIMGNTPQSKSKKPADYEAIHKALLSGLLGNIGYKTEQGGIFSGARGIKFLIHPSSSMKKNTGKWIMASELIQTTKLYARGVAKIEPHWIEEVGEHLVRRSIYEPHWEKKAMQVNAWERTTLYGLLINPKKRIHYGPRDPSTAREIFIRQALVAGEVAPEYIKRWEFFRHNYALIDEIENLEHKQRRQDILIDEDLIYDFYDKNIPETYHEKPIYNGASFDKWQRESARKDPKQLYLKKSDLMRHEAVAVTTNAFPPELEIAGVPYACSYHFEPGNPSDGVTLHLPITHLNQISEKQCEWLTPGLLKEKIVQLIKTLPQKTRARLVPVPSFAEDFIAEINQPQNSKKIRPGLIDALLDYIIHHKNFARNGWPINAQDFRPDALAEHLHMNFKLLDEDNQQIDSARQLARLREQYSEKAKNSFEENLQKQTQQQHHALPTQNKITTWDFGELPELMQIQNKQHLITGYPALLDEEDHVLLQVFECQETARRIHRLGLIRIFMLHFKEQLKQFKQTLNKANELTLLFMPLGDKEALTQQLAQLSFEYSCLQHPWPQNEVEFSARCSQAKPQITLVLQDSIQMTHQILKEWQTLSKKLQACAAHTSAHADIQTQSKQLVHPDFITEASFERMQHIPRYLKAAISRIDKLQNNPARDAKQQAEISPLVTKWQQYQQQIQNSEAFSQNPKMIEFRWLLEELRVSLFAQELKTAVPVSIKRLQKLWDEGTRTL